MTDKVKFEIVKNDYAVFAWLQKRANVASAEAIAMDRLGNLGLAAVRRQDARTLRAWASRELAMVGA